MRIDPKSNLGSVYETGVKKNSMNSEKGIDKNGGMNWDKVEISENASNLNELASVKVKIMNDVEKATKPEKLRELKARIENGTYNVKSEDIAEAIINLSKKTAGDYEND